MQSQSKIYPPISAIILAAGKSERFGAPKVLQLFQKVPFLVRIVEALRQTEIQTILLVLGHQAGQMMKKLPKIEDLTIVINKGYEDGQFSSLQAGIRKLPNGFSGCLSCLIDQPQIRAETIGKILKSVSQNSDKIIIPTYKNLGGHPVYIPKILFPDILNSTPSSSLRDIFSRNSELIFRLELNDPLIIEDVDTPADLQRVGKLYQQL